MSDMPSGKPHIIWRMEENGNRCAALRAWNTPQGWVLVGMDEPVGWIGNDASAEKFGGPRLKGNEPRVVLPSDPIEWERSMISHMHVLRCRHDHTYPLLLNRLAEDVHTWREIHKQVQRSIPGKKWHERFNE